MSHSLVHTSVSSSKVAVTNVFMLLWELEQLYWTSFPSILHMLCWKVMNQISPGMCFHTFGTIVPQSMQTANFVFSSSVKYSQFTGLFFTILCTQLKNYLKSHVHISIGLNITYNPISIKGKRTDIWYDQLPIWLSAQCLNGVFAPYFTYLLWFHLQDIEGNGGCKIWWKLSAVSRESF